MVLLRPEHASSIIRRCAPIASHGLSPQAFFLATRSISWGRTRRSVDGRGSKLVERKRLLDDAQQSPAPLPHSSSSSIGSGRRRARRPVSSAVPRTTISKPEVLPALVSGSQAPSGNEELTNAEHNVELSVFEEDEGDDKSRRAIDLAGVENFDKELAEEEKDIDERIRAIEEDDEEFPEIDDDFAKEFLNDEDREALVQSIADGWDSVKEDLPHNVEYWDGLPDIGINFVDNFNETLNELALKPNNEKAGIEVWRWYSRSKIYIKDFVLHVPDAAWNLLWLSQSEESPANPNRASHLRILADDMAKAGHTLSQSQKNARLEGLFIEGLKSKAFEEWEMAFNSGGAKDLEFLELGVRMYAASGNVDKTLELHNLLVTVHGVWNLEITLSVLALLLENDVSRKKAQAQDFYTRMRLRFGQDLNMEAYDAISLAFLKAGRRDLALSVFRDMMLVGDAVQEMSEDSWIRRIGDRVGQLISPGQISTSDVNKFMLEGMSYLPRKYLNKYFFAKWLRKLISMGEVDAAAMVVELMYERGVRPDAIHVNGLIGAWLRENTPESQKRATTMAWAMIQARLDQVHDRKLKGSLTSETRGRSVLDGADGLRIPTWKTRPTPAATIETFCIIVKHYLQEEAFDTVRHIRNLLSYSEIPMNSVFMNHLLYAELHHRTYSAAWARFEVMSRTVVADMETWICLWEGEKQEILDAANRKAMLNNPNSKFPKPRQLFATMMKWRNALQGQHLRDALEDMENDTYNDVVRCFCLARDWIGAFVAMREMTNKFNVYPVPSTVRMLLLQMSKMSTVRNRPGKRVTQPAKADVEQRMEQTTEVLSLITQHRQDLLLQKGIDFEKNLDEVQQQEESLRTLLQLIFTITTRVSAMSRTDFQGQLAKAAAEMGVELYDAEESMRLVA